MAKKEKQLEDLTDEELDQLLEDEVAAGMMEVTIENGVKKWSLTAKGTREVEKLLERNGIATGKSIIEEAKKGGR